MISTSRSSLLKSHQNCRYPNFHFSVHFSSILAKNFTFDLGKSSWENPRERFQRDISRIHPGKFCFIKPSLARKPGKTWEINLAKSHQFSSLASPLAEPVLQSIHQTETQWFSKVPPYRFLFIAAFWIWYWIFQHKFITFWHMVLVVFHFFGSIF